MTIYINGTKIVQPTVLTENLGQIQTDNVSIAGNRQRNRLGQKKNSVMEFQNVAPADYQKLISLFTTGSGVGYLNDQSNYVGGTLTFSGLPSFTENRYVEGASLWRPITVTIEEV